MNVKSPPTVMLPGNQSRGSLSPWLLLDACVDAIAIIEANGTIAFANSAMGGWLGSERDRLAGANLWDLCPAARAAHLQLLVKRAIRTGAPAHYVDSLDQRWFEYRLEPCLSDPSTTQVAFYARDITRQVEAEEGQKLTNLRLITAQEDERRRIAQDLHDDIGQRMTALLLSLKAAHDAAESGESCAADQLEAAIRMLEDMMKQVRQIIYQLRPPLLATLPLSRALEALAASFAQSSGLHVDFSSEEGLPLIPEAQAMVLYRFVQEGLNNTGKHAHATSAWINLDCDGGEISVSLEDDGQGFDPERGPALGIGLQGLRDRFSMLNGHFVLESVPGGGTRLCGSLPLAEDSK